MTRQTAAPLERLSLSVATRDVYGVVSELRDGYLAMGLPYQRQSEWTTEERLTLVSTWMLGLDLPMIIVNDRTSLPWREANGDVSAAEAPAALVDGKQRLLTALAWFAGALTVPSSWFPADQVRLTSDAGDGPYVGYTGLTRAAQLHCRRNWLLPVATAQVRTVADEARLFLRYNRPGTSRPAEDLAPAVAVAAGKCPGITWKSARQGDGGPCPAERLRVPGAT